jgi:diguanylate cyclase (GGDEF)-like protein/PAS domain S-box-containing protein
MVNATFLVDDLVGGAMARHSELHLIVREDGEVIHGTSRGAPPAGFLVTQSTLVVADRPWQLEFSAPVQSFRPAGNAALPWVALAGGLVITLLLSGLVGSLATSSRRAQRIAARMTDDLRRSQADLAESQQRTQKLIETLPNPVFFKGTDGRYLGVNEAWERFFGMPRDAIIGKTVHDLYQHDLETARRKAEMDDVLWRSPGTQVYEMRISLASGAYRDAVYYKATFTGPDGKVAGLIGTIIDVTEQKRAEQRLHMEHAVTRVLAEADSTQSGLQGVMRAICEAEGWDCARVYLIDERAGVLRFSEAWGIDHEGVRSFIERTRDMVFAPGQGLAGRSWQTGEPVWSGDISADPRAIRRFASDYGMRGSFILPLLSAGKTLGVAAFASRVVREPDARLLEAAGVVGSQVGQFLIRKQAEEAVRFVATHDELTKLPNRVMFGQRLEHAISQAARHGRRRLAVLFLDLDRFKVINDTMGHDVGDAVLREVARRLSDSLRASDTVARLGGDEFVVLLEELSDPMYVTAVAHKLLLALAQPVVLGGREYHVTASIGASAYPDDSVDAQALLKNADIAMYRAKEHGRNTFQFYSAQLNLHTVERLTLESGLRRALERDELRLYFQPQVELRSGRITGVEALVRWQHPEHGLLAPARFIGIAEETGLIVPIGNWVLQAACDAHSEWARRGLPLRIAVNLSARQFAHDNLVRDIRSLMGGGGFGPGRLELEITESMVMRDPDRVVALLRELRQAGVRVSIDDFGTGHSSLAYLKRFPVDSLKIDRSFIAGVPDDLGDVAITHAVIGMAHNLGMKVIAEGVETKLQRDFLAAQDCDEYQGYFFSKPVPAEEILALLSPPAKPISSRASS